MSRITAQRELRNQNARIIAAVDAGESFTRNPDDFAGLDGQITVQAVAR